MLSFQSIATLAFATLALADSAEFGAIVIRSGSQYQNAGVSVTNGQFTAGGGSNYLDATITDDGRLKLKDGSYAVVGTNSVTTGTTGSSPFAIQNGFLTYKGNSGWSINNGILVPGNAGGVSYGLSPRSFSNGQPVPDFQPSGSNKNSSANSSNVTTTPGVITQSNGANGLGAAGVGAVLAAAGAFLL